VEVRRAPQEQNQRFQSAITLTCAGVLGLGSAAVYGALAVRGQRPEAIVRETFIIQGAGRCEALPRPVPPYR
jgi:hypothetical protein